MTRNSRSSVLPVLYSIALFSGCGGQERPVAATAEHPAGARAESCPVQADAPTPLPGIRPEERSLAYWLEVANDGVDLDAPLLSVDAIAHHNRTLNANAEGLPISRSSLEESLPDATIEAEVRERLTYMKQRIEAGSLVRGEEGDIDSLASMFELPPDFDTVPDLRVATESISLRCGPLRESLYAPPIDRTFDRNACSSIERQEPVQILSRWRDGMLLARTRYTFGWIPMDAPLSPPIPPARVRAWIKGPLARVAQPLTLVSGEEGAEVDSNVLLPVMDDSLLFATTSGFYSASNIAHTEVGRPLTRRAFLTEVFRHLDEPYGWGGQNGLDCSELVMDVLSTFGLELPRHSSRQAEAGTFTVDIPADASESERLALIDSAAESGVVVLHFPGHIMFWLGRNAHGEPRIIHSFAEYLVPCDGDGETMVRPNRVDVSDLELGRGTSRTAFIERLTRLTVFGQGPNAELAEVAEPTPAAVVFPDRCRDSAEVRGFASPARPDAHHPLRWIVTSSRDLGAFEIAARSPSGREVRDLTIHRLGGPPFSAWVEIERPEPGRWTLVIGDGERVDACDEIGVNSNPRRADETTPSQERIWAPRWSWEEDTENLYSAFVEQLFAYPMDDRTWSSLSELIRDRDHNLIYDHLGLDEDTRVDLVPDCADLPYFLRAYFAWKMRLPFAFRHCSRGRPGRPPSCGELVTTGMEHSYTNEVDAFSYFALRNVRPGVHSASVRTAPRDDASDLYPLPLTREALRPGTVYADPYGHLMVVSAWRPQASQTPGALYAADAQPDGTVGRRIFWRGTFLFTPETSDVGAGFKGWRPVVFDRRQSVFVELSNEELRDVAIARAHGVAPWSNAQYEGSATDFYDRVEALINPRPLDADARAAALVDALQESVVRRVVSIENGRVWVRENPGQTIPMPEGSDIFLTSGPWEDFSTPSRDLRLLIAIDTVVQFPDTVRRHPERWGIDAARIDGAVDRLRQHIRADLEGRRFEYTRSDGSGFSLTLAQVIDRAPSLELAWNPNDCAEIRWGASADTAEASTCHRRAPAEQRSAMEGMRTWFASRERPISY